MQQIPDVMPVLSSGAHDGPEDGACFMEYVSMLAGEQWSDNPQCVETGLATTMQVINDDVGDDNRHLLVPLLGRGIGLAPAPCFVPNTWERHRYTDEEWAKLLMKENSDKLRYRDEGQILRNKAWWHFSTRLGLVFDEEIVREDAAQSVAQYFKRCADAAWSKDVAAQYVKRCDSGSMSYGYTQHLVDWATKLHEAYEQAMEELGWNRHAYEVKCSAVEMATYMTYPELFNHHTHSYV